MLIFPYHSLYSHDHVLILGSTSNKKFYFTMACSFYTRDPPPPGTNLGKPSLVPLVMRRLVRLYKDGHKTEISVLVCLEKRTQLMKGLFVLCPSLYRQTTRPITRRTKCCLPKLFPDGKCVTSIISANVFLHPGKQTCTSEPLGNLSKT